MALEKSVALSELQLPSLHGRFIALTFQGYASIQFIQALDLHGAPPLCSALYGACRKPGLPWKRKARLRLTHRARHAARNPKGSQGRGRTKGEAQNPHGFCLPLPSPPAPSPPFHPPPSHHRQPCDHILPWGHHMCARTVRPFSPCLCPTAP